jgi:hypothetical protein
MEGALNRHIRWLQSSGNAPIRSDVAVGSVPASRARVVFDSPALLIALTRILDGKQWPARRLSYPTCGTRLDWTRRPPVAPYPRLDNSL